MKSCSLAVFVGVLVIVLVAPAVLARPPHRQKRVSDQRLGELEALLALKKLRGKLVTVPVAFGQINPNDYGRKRRSAPHSIGSSASSSHALLERILEALPQDDVSQDVYDELPVAPVALEGGPLGGLGDVQSQHWAASGYDRDRPAAAFNRPLTE